ncbi:MULTISPECIES: sensor histidine kinase [Paenibacillus]|uniref:histidine kinase n=1 Tax=Paenibacillus albilobatus TaxID=2716884 RepID=A0A919XEC2_9BACL|nr:MULTISPECIES: sensor histidine kinase [Paenibacillus]GIO30119.1 two-component sensor histidine kinase [Paenibacillus albilobatus]
MNRWNRIDFKLGAVMLGLFIVVLLLLGVVFNGLFTKFTTKQSHNEAEELAAHVVGMLKKQPSASANLIGTMSEFSNVDIFMLREDGTFSERDMRLIRERGYPDGIWDKPSLLASRQVETEFAVNGKWLLLHGKPMQDSGGRFSGGIYVISSLEAMKHSIRTIRMMIMMTGAGALIVTLGLVFVLSRKLSRPLLQIEKAARRIAKGEFETRMPVARKDEIGSLIGAINDLAGELQRYRDTRNEFFANISHELRTPVTYLEGYADVLAKGLIRDEEEQQETLGIIAREARRLMVLIRELFDLAKMEEGRIDLCPEWVDVNELFDKSALKVKLRAEDKGVAVRVSHPEKELHLWADVNRMEQILMNLLDNAVTFTSEGEIVLAATREKDRIRIEVRDSGPGIPAEELPYVFERFYRVEKSRSRQYGGSGLGLSIVKKLAELQGAAVEVRSRLGEGTSFAVVFPAGACAEEKGIGNEPGSSIDRR